MADPNAADTGRLVATRRDAVLELAITNPAARNALSPAIYADGLRAFAEASADPAVRVVMLHGADNFFCAGGNLNRLLANRAQPPEHQRASVDQLNRWALAIRACPKPVIALVQGAAAGAGFSIALACDLIVAEKDARFVMAYARVGLSPDGGAIAALAAALPPQQVFALCALAEPVSGTDLHAAGIVHLVSEPAAALADARALCDRLAHGPTAVYGRIKRLLQEAPRRALAEHLDAERDAFVTSLHEEDAGEGIDAFLAKRPAQFRGA
ncbi:MAG: enoyl-CoA hydratase [Burkholderiaceae bacterium]|nr:enoyl-CoA hydratase [Burkholderiaceae bacterium]